MYTHLKEDIIHKYTKENKSCKTIADELGISSSYVFEHLKEWGIKLRKANRQRTRVADNYKDEIIEMYINQKLSVLKIAKQLGISQYTIYDGLKDWGVDRRTPSEMSSFTANYNFFDSIDNEHKAYWLGFMYADGYITSNNYVGLTLARMDRGHIEKYIKDLESNHNINDYTIEPTEKSFNNKTVYSSRLLFKSEHMCNSLKDKGCVENKSLILTFPSYDIIPKHLIRHFLRGYFDGDGSLILSKGSINFKICGTEEFLNGIVEVLNENIPSYSFNKDNFDKKDKESDKNNYSVSYGGRVKTLTVMNWLYKDSTIYLDRKYELYKKLMQI